MELNSIINDNDISIKMQDIYKYIEKNEDKIDIILDDTFDDLRNTYPNIIRTQDSVEVSNIELQSLMHEKERITSVLQHYSRITLGDMNHLMSYCFKIVIINQNTVAIKKR